MRPETRAALEQARDEYDLNTVAVIARYLDDGWDSYWPWPGASWMNGRYESWGKYRDHQLLLAGIFLESR